jgi:hypothetical protein
MPWGRVAAITGAVVGVLWFCLDSGVGDTAPAPGAASAALLIFAFVFGTGAWVMRVGGRPERVPTLTGLSIGAAAYALIRLTLPG